MTWIDDLTRWVAHLDASQGSNKNMMVNLTVDQVREVARWRASHLRLQRLRAGPSENDPLSDEETA
jgi:hypothetical protein